MNYANEDTGYPEKLLEKSAEIVNRICVADDDGSIYSKESREVLFKYTVCLKLFALCKWCFIISTGLKTKLTEKRVTKFHYIPFSKCKDIPNFLSL